MPLLWRPATAPPGITNCRTIGIPIKVSKHIPGGWNLHHAQQRESFWSFGSPSYGKCLHQLEVFIMENSQTKWMIWGTPILGNPWKPPYQTEVTRITSWFFGKLWKKNLPDWSSYLQWILVTETPEPRMSFPMIFVCYVSIFAHIWAAEKTSKKT